MAVEIANIVPQMVWMIGDLVGTIAGVTHCGEDLKRKPLASLSVMDTKRRYQMNDELVRHLAENVLGWEKHYRNLQGVDKKLSYYKKGSNRLVGLVSEFDPFNDIFHAWLVVEAIKGDWFEMGWLAGLYRVQFEKPNMRVAEQTYHEHVSESLCEAICIAAAKATGWEG